MFNRHLFAKICDVSCSFNELEEFVIDIDKKEFDLQNPFEKYYSVDKIILAIEKYQANEIDAKFLAYWMNAYNWIIMGGFKIEKKDESISLKEFLIWTISDWLDSLSFFNVDNDWYNLEDYKNAYKVFDLVLQDINHCKAVFADYGDNEGDAVVLIRNDNSKYYIKVYGELDYNNEMISFEKVEYAYLDNQAKQLLNLGYQELKYGNWEDED